MISLALIVAAEAQILGSIMNAVGAGMSAAANVARNRLDAATAGSEEDVLSDESTTTTTTTTTATVGYYGLMATVPLDEYLMLNDALLSARMSGRTYIGAGYTRRRVYPPMITADSGQSPYQSIYQYVAP